MRKFYVTFNCNLLWDILYRLHLGRELTMNLAATELGQTSVWKVGTSIRQDRERLTIVAKGERA